MMNVTLRNFTVSAAVIAGLALATVATPASAGEKTGRAGESSIPSRTVNFRDLDLAKMKDAAELHRRIAVAAYQVCRPHIDRHNVRSISVYRHCLDAAIDNAVKKVGNVNLTMVHEGHGPTLAKR